MTLTNRQAMADQGAHDARLGVPAFCWFGPAGTLWTRRADSDHVNPRLIDAENSTELLEACAYALAYEDTSKQERQ